MNVRAPLSLLVVVGALTACSSSGTNGHLIPGPGGATSVSAGGGAATASAGATVAVSSATPGAGSNSLAAVPAAFCAKLEAAQSRLADLSANASNPNDVKAILEQQIAAFKGLADGAPGDVKPAIEDLVKVMTAAKTAFADPSHVDPSALQGLSANLPKDAQTIGEYVGTKCAGG